MSLLELFWNLRQQQQIASATTTATVAASGTRLHESALSDLNNRFERLALVTQALAELLAERVNLSEADLVAKIHEIDLRDGARDGRAATPSRKCPACGRPSPGPRNACLYCGASLSPSRPFEGL